MRGGLGKTLLLAFLLLTIFPLGLLAFLTYNQIQHDTRDKLLASLATVVALKEAHLEDWIDAYEQQLALVAQGLEQKAGKMAQPEAGYLSSWFEVMEQSGSALTGVVLVDAAGGGTVDQVGQVSARACEVAAARVVDGDVADRRLLWVEHQGTDGEVLVPGVVYAGQRWVLLGILRPEALQRVVSGREVIGSSQQEFDEGIVTSLVAGMSEGSDLVVVSPEGTARLSAHQEKGEAIGQVVTGGQGMGAYQDLAGQEVFGAYRWSAELGVGLLAEKRQVVVLAAGDEMTALLVAATLGAALVSAAIAAVVTRRVTRPIVELTETAAWLARGDLNQHVEVTRRDEIGVLGRAFNRMASELRVLYGSLEAKVEERTQAWREANEALEEANEYTRYYVMQLAISAEVARVAASIRDLGKMLETVVELVGRAFELRYVAIYLVDGTGGWAVWEVGTPGIEPAERRVAVGGPTLVGRAARPTGTRVRPPSGTAAQGRVPGTGVDGEIRGDSPPRMGKSVGERTGGRVEKVVRPDGGWELAIPLCVRGEVLGVLVLESSWDGTRAQEAGEQREAGWVSESDWVVYQSLADQISIAIENARAYALERETVERLRELDRIQAEFLTNMSHALRTPLNSVIGFSRVMLKELDGPLTETQHADLTTIYEAGRQLLGLLNDMLDLSQLDMGLVSWSPGEVDLAEVIEGVMATTQALARNKPIQLRADVADTLPCLYTDGQRVRQVILALLSNAVKYTDSGTITLTADPSPGTAATAGGDTRADEVTIRVAIQGTGSETGLASVWAHPAARETPATLPQQGARAEAGDGQASAAAGRLNGQEAPTGFGLAVSKRVVEKLGGTIWLNHGGEGLVFTLTLPVRWEREEGTGDEGQVTANK